MKFCVLILCFCLTLTGCQTTVAVSKATSNTLSAVKGIQNDVNFIAGYIADTWAQKETECANNSFNRAIASHTVTATIIDGKIPSPGTSPVTVQTVDENIRTIETANKSRVMAQIAIGHDRLRNKILNYFNGNLAAAQAELTGMQNYYSVNSNTSLLQSGEDGIIQAFQTFAPVLTGAPTPNLPPAPPAK